MNKIFNQQLISRRLFLIGIAKLLLLFILFVRLFFMQIFKRKEYLTLSDKNRINLLIISEVRGKIYDNSNKLLATNSSQFQLKFDRKHNKNYHQEISDLARALSLNELDSANLLTQAKKSSASKPVILIKSLTWKQVAIIEELKPNLQSLTIESNSYRIYPYGSFAAHIVGYIGLITKSDKSEFKITESIKTHIGKTGVEKHYNEILKGEPGYKHIEVNAYGRHVRELAMKPCICGEELFLSIDMAIQEKAYGYINAPGTSIVASDITNGKIVVMASNPSYDPNNFNQPHINYWQDLIADPYKPLINKAVAGNYPPGSIFKLVTILAALNAGIPTSKIISCHGQSALNTNSFRCASHAGHGRIDMFGAIKYSCNIYMFEIAKIIGPSRILDMAEQLGLGQLTNIDLPNESPGFLPSLKWKEKVFKRSWTIGDTLNLAIGQGSLLTTPLQMAHMTAIIASGGKIFQPQLIRGNSINIGSLNIKPEYFQTIKDMMFLVMNSQGGTAYGSRLDNFLVAGKTGTSQVQAKKNLKDDLSKDSVAWISRNHGAFVGFGPFYNPKFAISVFVEHGGSGSRAAAPIANKVLSDLFQKYL